jgi:hypothetical protein
LSMLLFLCIFLPKIFLVVPRSFISNSPLNWFFKYWSQTYSWRKSICHQHIIISTQMNHLRASWNTLNYHNHS